MKIKSLILGLILISACFVSCQNPNEGEANPSGEIQKTEEEAVKDNTLKEEIDNKEKEKNENNEEQKSSADEKKDDKSDNKEKEEKEEKEEDEKDKELDITKIRKLTSEQRDEFKYWVGLSNTINFDESEYKNIAIAFNPQDDGYNAGTLKYSWFAFLMAAVFGVFLILYLIGRFLLNKFKGPKTFIDENYKRLTWISFIIGIIGAITFLSLTMVYSNRIK